ncbi:MAG: hypothetical protein ACRD2S_01220 [Terriglobales bacterium]
MANSYEGCCVIMIRRIFPLVLAIFASILTTSMRAQQNGTVDNTRPDDASVPSLSTEKKAPVVVYVRPGEKTKLLSYAFEMVGPYPIVGAAFAAGINQAENTPPEWKQGAQAYGQRFGSDFGIAAITTTTRYALAEAFREDTVYYRCECKGIMPRLEHAVISTVTARRGEDGRRTFSFPGVIAPYAGTMTAVYAWFPSRYNAEDAFRMGNYNLLGFVGGNIALEFLYGGPHTLMSRIRHK